MSGILLEGKQIAANIKIDLARQLNSLKRKFDKVPHLATVQVGGDPASNVYVKAQKGAAQRLGIEYSLHLLDDESTELDLINFIKKLNKDPKVTGILLQLPLPPHMSINKVTAFIDPKKDVEGMHPENLGRIVYGTHIVAPCTVLAVMELIQQTGVDLYGKEVVVVGHSEIVGKPLSLMLLNKFATVTTCHIGTSDRKLLTFHVRGAEILVVAVGKASIVRGKWIQEGAIVIDVGINKIEDKLVGDVEFDVAKNRASFITPVPGGVGPLTVTMLMKNTIELFKVQMGV